MNPPGSDSLRELHEHLRTSAVFGDLSPEAAEAVAAGMQRSTAASCFRGCAPS